MPPLFCILLLSVLRMSHPSWVSSNLLLVRLNLHFFFSFIFFLWILYSCLCLLHGEGFNALLLIWKSSLYFKNMNFCLSHMSIFHNWWFIFRNVYCVHVLFGLIKVLNLCAGTSMQVPEAERSALWAKVGWELSMGFSKREVTGDLDKEALLDKSCFLQTGWLWPLFSSRYASFFTDLIHWRPVQVQVRLLL